MTQIFFDIMAAVVVLGALGVVFVRNVVYAALFLILSLMGVAGVYLLLSVEFLALVQVLIYGGAVTVLVLFALMLTRVPELKQKLDGDQRPLGAVAALVLMSAFGAMIHQTTWPRDIHEVTVVPFATIGNALFNRWAVPFEIASGILLVALIGAVVIAMQEERER